MKILSAYIELTNRCNFNCRTCYNRSGLNRVTEELPIDVLIRTITRFQEYGAKSFLLSGGETMMYSDIEALFALAEKMPEVLFTISTNGTVKQSVLLDAYRRLSNLYVQISLDGSCETVNARTRGQENFGKTVMLLEGLRNSEQPGRYRLKMVVSKVNRFNIPAYFDFAFNYGCEPQFSFMNPLGNGGDHWSDMSLNSAEKMTALRLIDEANKKYGTKIVLPFCAFSCPLADDPNDVKLGCMVKANGEMMPCQGLYDGHYRLGNVYDFDENEVIGNLRRLREITQKRMQTDYECSKCILTSICKRGCPASAASMGDIFGSDGDCEFRLKHYLKYQLR